MVNTVKNIKNGLKRSKAVENGQKWSIHKKKQSLYPPTTKASIYLYTPGLLKNQTLNLLTWADSSTDTKTHRHKQKRKKKEEEKEMKKSYFTCNASGVTCHVWRVT